MQITVSPNRPLCVYMHSCGNDIIYVGSGTVARAFSLGPSHRTKLWLEMVGNRPVTITILEFCWYPDQAIAREYYHIAGLQPLANVHGKKAWLSPLDPIANGRPQKWQNGARWVKCLPTGRRYENASQAALGEGLSVATVLRLLRHGQRGEAGKSFHFVSRQGRVLAAPAAPPKPSGKRPTLRIIERRALGLIP
jgi:hypothetical protein